MSIFGSNIITLPFLIVIIGFAIALFILINKTVAVSGIPVLIVCTITIFIASRVLNYEQQIFNKEKEKLYNKNQKFICGERIVSKANGWVLDGNYFRKNDQAINIYDCKIFVSAKVDKKQNKRNKK